MTTVSVLLPVRDGARFVGRAAASVLAQSRDDLELVVVDDGSRDNSSAVVSSIGDSRIRLVRQEGRGVGAALNAALRVAEGDFVAMLGADDVWLPGLVEALLPALAQDPGIAVSYGRAQAMDDAGLPLPQLAGAPPRFPDQPLATILYGNCICTIAALARLADVVAVGGFDERLIAEDWDLWIRLLSGGRLAYTPRVLARFRLSPNSHTGPRSPHYVRISRDHVTLVERFYASDGLSPEAEHVRALALRNVYLHAAVRLLVVGAFREARPYVRRALTVGPSPAAAAARLAAQALFYRWLSRRRWGVVVTERAVALRRAWALRER